jgi:hypothetical protein
VGLTIYPGTLSATGLPGRAQTNAKIRIEVVPIEPRRGLLCERHGLFAEADLDVQIQPMLGGSAIVAAVASNAVDIGFSTIDALATHIRKMFHSSLLRPLQNTA